MSVVANRISLTLCRHMEFVQQWRHTSDPHLLQGAEFTFMFDGCTSFWTVMLTLPHPTHVGRMKRLSRMLPQYVTSLHDVTNVTLHHYTVTDDTVWLFTFTDVLYVITGAIWFNDTITYYHRCDISTHRHKVTCHHIIFKFPSVRTTHNPLEITRVMP